MVTIPNLSSDTTPIDNESSNTNSEQSPETITSSPEDSVRNVDIQSQNTKNEQQEKLVKIIKLRE